MDTIMARRMRSESFNDKQLQLIIGSLLGDAHLVKTTRGFAFRVSHGLKQRRYIGRKYQILKDFVRTSPRRCQDYWYFRTISHPLFDNLRRIFYKDSRKVIPYRFLSRHLSPFALGIWIMDDGAKDKNQLRINSQGYTKRENEWLREILRAKLGIESTLNKDKDRYRIRISQESMPKLIKLVKPHMIPSMLYKLPRNDCS